MRRALPARSAGQIVAAIARAHRVMLSERTVRAYLRRMGLTRGALAGEPPRAFGRFDASRPNEIWIGDVAHGPFVPHPRVAGSRRAKLLVLVDDHSRLLVHGRWMAEENTRAGQDVQLWSNLSSSTRLLPTSCDCPTSPSSSPTPPHSSVSPPSCCCTDESSADAKALGSVDPAMACSSRGWVGR